MAELADNRPINESKRTSRSNSYFFTQAQYEANIARRRDVVDAALAVNGQ
jgi:hypothetical protein